MKEEKVEGVVEERGELEIVFKNKIRINKYLYLKTKQARAMHVFTIGKSHIK